MISRAQQILVKRAQREAGLGDAEYRDALAAVSGCRSTTDPRMTDRHVDLALGYFEAIHWRKVDSGELQPVCRPDAIFRQRRYWASKNTAQETSRDRYTAANLDDGIAGLEAALGKLGFSLGYCAAIRERVSQGRKDAYSQHLYKAALQRTLRSKQRKFAGLAPAATSKT